MLNDCFDLAIIYFANANSPVVLTLALDRNSNQYLKYSYSCVASCWCYT